VVTPQHPPPCYFYIVPCLVYSVVTFGEFVEVNLCGSYSSPSIRYFWTPLGSECVTLSIPLVLFRVFWRSGPPGILPEMTPPSPLRIPRSRNLAGHRNPSRPASDLHSEMGDGVPAPKITPKWTNCVPGGGSGHLGVPDGGPGA
jgi:hypothetical protein